MLWHYPLLQVTFTDRSADSKTTQIYSRSVCGYLTQQSFALRVQKSDLDSLSMVITEPSKETPLILLV